MALIDETGILNNGDENKQNLVCNSCKITLPANAKVDICENCFNDKNNENLKKIKENVKKIKFEIEKIDIHIDKLNKELARKDLHIIAINGINIDLINVNAIRQKLLIDLDANKKGFDLCQVQAADFRKMNGWKEKETLNLDI